MARSKPQAYVTSLKGNKGSSNAVNTNEKQSLSRNDFHSMHIFSFPSDMWKHGALATLVYFKRICDIDRFFSKLFIFVWPH